MFCFIDCSPNTAVLTVGTHSLHHVVPFCPSSFSSQYKPEYYYFESVMMLFKLALLVALVFFEHGSQSQHAAVVMVSASMLFVQARLEPFSSKQKNVLQYLGTGLTFLMAFGGVMLSYMRVSQAEASSRLFGEEQRNSTLKYEGNMGVIRGTLDVVLYVFTIPPTVAFVLNMVKKVRKKLAKRKAKKAAKKAERNNSGLRHTNPMFNRKSGASPGASGEGKRSLEMTSPDPESATAALTSGSAGTRPGASPGASGEEKRSLEMTSPDPEEGVAAHTPGSAGARQGGGTGADVEARMELGEITGPEVKVDDVVYRDVKEEEGEDAVVVPEEALLQEEKSPLTADELHAL